MSETYPKVLSEWTSSDGVPIRVAIPVEGCSAVAEINEWSDQYDDDDRVWLVDRLCARIAALESEKATAQRERDEARAQSAQLALDVKRMHERFDAAERTATTPAPAPLPGMPSAEEMETYWYNHDGPDGLPSASWTALHSWLLSRLSGARPSVADIIGYLTSTTDLPQGDRARDILAMFPAPERQDGERPDRDALALALVNADRDMRCPYQSLEDVPLYRRETGFRMADAAISLLSPPLTARSSDATVSVERLAQAMCDGHTHTSPECAVSCAKIALSLLPARSSAEGEALDRIAASYKKWEASGSVTLGEHVNETLAALRSTGRLAGKEQGK